MSTIGFAENAEFSSQELGEQKAKTSIYTRSCHGLCTAFLKASSVNASLAAILREHARKLGKAYLEELVQVVADGHVICIPSSDTETCLPLFRACSPSKRLKLLRPHILYLHTIHHPFDA